MRGAHLSREPQQRLERRCLERQLEELALERELEHRRVRPYLSQILKSGLYPPWRKLNRKGTGLVANCERPEKVQMILPKVKSGHMAQIAQYDNCKIAILNALKDKNKPRNNKAHAHSNARLKKKIKRRIIKVKSHLGRRAWRLKTVLETESYKAPKMREFTVYDGTKHKKRNITEPDWASQFVHHAVDNIIGKIIEKRNYFYDCGNMKNKGLHLAIKHAKKLFANTKNKYYLQFDVAQYYPTIPHKKLIWMLRNRVTKDKPTLRLLWEIIKSSGKNGVGIAIGFEPSKLFAVFYLQCLDYEITQKFAPKCGYIRYADDGLIVGPNKRVLTRAQESIALYLKKLGLSIKGMWQVRKIKERKMLFLGYRFGRGFVIMGKTKMYRISRAARYAAHRRISAHRAAQLLSYWGALKACNSYHFRQERFDKFVSINNCKGVISNESKRKQRACGCV